MTVMNTFSPSLLSGRSLSMMYIADIIATVVQMTAMAAVRCVLPVMSNTKEATPRIEAVI